VPLKVQGRITLAGKVRDVGGAGPRHVCRHVHGVRRVPLMVVGEGLRPDLVGGEGFCRERRGSSQMLIL